MGRAPLGGAPRACSLESRVNMVVSPYHLTTREPAVMASFALARRVVTVLPGSGDGGGTARALPAFARVMKSWAWTVAFWKTGLLTGEQDGVSPDADVLEAARHMEADAGCFPLRHFLRVHDYDNPRAYLNALANDLMKGGPDPGLSLPVAAGLDRFAARTGCIVARGAASSLAQRAESSISTPVFNAVVPVFLQATSERVLHFREVLADEVAGFGAAIERMGLAGEARGDAEVQESASSLTRAFERRREELYQGSSEDEVRPIEGAVSLQGVRLPWDAVLVSSVRAVEQLSGAGAGPVQQQEHPVHTALPVLRDDLAGKSFLSLVVRPIGASAGRSGGGPNK